MTGRGQALATLREPNVGQLAVGPLGAVFGVRDVLLVCGVAYAVICVATLGSRSVRDLQRVDHVAVR